MQKLAVVLVGLALAGCASTSGSHALRIDATSQSNFEASVAAFQQALPPNRRLHFEVALQELWKSTASKTESSVDQTTKDYFAQLNGLDYEQVISLAGAEAKERYQSLFLPDKYGPATTWSPNWVDPFPPALCMSCLDPQYSSDSGSSPNVSPR
jgi:hypothetical protein